MAKRGQTADLAGPGRPWLLVASILGTMLLAGAGMSLVVMWAHHQRPASTTGVSTDLSQVAASDPLVVVLAGTGAAIPLMEALAAKFAAVDGGAISVQPSIGSSGGLSALQDGRIDCALVSRELRPGEKGGHTSLHLADAPVALVAGRRVLPAQLSASQLASLYDQETPFWTDGRPVTVFLREKGDSGTSVFAGRFPQFSMAHARSLKRGSPHVAFTDLEMERALVSYPRSLGLFDFGTIGLRDLDLSIVQVDGLSPQDDLASYPLVRPVLLVYEQGRKDRLERFLKSICSKDGREFMRASGYRPVCREGEVSP